MMRSIATHSSSCSSKRSRLEVEEMTTSKWFEDLEVWQSAKELTNLINRLTGSGSFARNLGLRDQMRKSATAIMSNIAEGFESQTQVLFLRFLASAKSAA